MYLLDNLLVSGNIICFKIICTTLFGWYLMVTGVSTERTNLKNITHDIPLLDKQHDYNLTFERIERVRYDQKYVNFYNVLTYKYNRTTPVSNSSMMFKVDIGNELEVVVQVYRFASNEYRRYPIRMQFNLCKAFEKDTIGLGDAQKCGTFTGCPIVKGKNYTICNWAPNPSKFPPLIPDGHYMGEFQAMFRNIELLTLRGYATIFRPVLIPGLGNTICIKIICTVLLGWYLMVTGVSTERTNVKNISHVIPLLDRQQDYNLSFERIEGVRYDQKYVNFFTLLTYKYNRTTPVSNGSLMFKVDIGNELEIVAQMYRFASNEYRRYPIRLQLNLCKAVEKDIIGLGDLRKCGTFTGCPIVKGKNYTMCNWEPNPSKFPPLIPDGQYMGEYQAMFRNVELLTVRGYATIFRPVLIPGLG